MSQLLKATNILGRQIVAHHGSALRAASIGTTGLKTFPSASSRAPIMIATMNQLPRSTFNNHHYYSTKPSSSSTSPSLTSVTTGEEHHNPNVHGTDTAHDLTLKTANDAPEAPKGIFGKMKGFVNKGKEIVIQCKDGVKILWSNRKVVKDLKASQRNEGYEWNRREFQLVHKTDIDIKRLIPFAAIFILATEYIPLIIIFAPGMIPTTCVTPSQLEGRRKKIHEKRAIMTEKLIRLNRREITKESLASFGSFVKVSQKYGEAFDFDMIDREHLSSFCKYLGLNGFGPSFMLRKRLTKHLDYIQQDDRLIQQQGIEDMTLTELQLANEERGMRSLEVSRDHLSQSLAYWVKLSTNESPKIPQGLLVFSRMFLLHATFKPKETK